MSFLDRIAARAGMAKPAEKRFAFGDWLELFNFNNQIYTVPQTFTRWGRGQEGPSGGFPFYAAAGMGSSSVVFACMAARMHVFSQVRYQFQALRDGRPGDLFGTPDLSVLETPWVGGTTGNLNTRILTYGDLGGNAYVTRNSRGELRVLRPDWVTILAAGEDLDGIDAQVQGYMYKPPEGAAEFIAADRVAHYAPYPDPLATWRGMSPLTAVLKNVQSHKAATDYKNQFFVNGSTPNMIVKVDPLTDLETFKAFKEQFTQEYFGARNAGKTWFLGGGADATVVGNTFQEMSFADIQEADEEQICAAFGVPLQMVGLGGGKSAGLNQGNYDSSKRQFADTTIQHLAQEAATSLETLIPAPSGSRLWFDTRDIPFFRQDEQSEADVRFKDAQTIRQLIDAGFKAESITAALQAGDWSQLQHTGLTSVQLVPPGTGEPAVQETPNE